VGRADVFGATSPTKGHSSASTQALKQALKGFNNNAVAELPENKRLNPPCVHQSSVTERVYCLANRTPGKRDAFRSSSPATN
jgi:hypothetical protein